MSDDDLERLANEAEAGHDPARMRRVRQWRVGTKLGRTLYAVTNPGKPNCGDGDAALGDRFVGMMESRELAQFVVDAVNHFYAIDPDNPCPAVVAVNHFHGRDVVPEDQGAVLAAPPQTCLPVVPLDPLSDDTDTGHA